MQFLFSVIFFFQSSYVFFLKLEKRKNYLNLIVFVIRLNFVQFVLLLNECNLFSFFLLFSTVINFRFVLQFTILIAFPSLSLKAISFSAKAKMGKTSDNTHTHTQFSNNLPFQHPAPAPFARYFLSIHRPSLDENSDNVYKTAFILSTLLSRT